MNGEFKVVLLLALQSVAIRCQTISVVLPDNSCLSNPFLTPPCVTLDRFAANPGHAANTTLDMESGVHPLSSTLAVSGGTNLTISGTNVTINCSTRSIEINIEQFSHTYITGVRFLNCGGRRLGRDGRTLVLNKVSFVNSSGRYIYGSESIHISNVYIENAGSFHAGFYARPQRLVVEDSVFVNAGELIIWNTDYSRIERCSFTHSRIYLSIDSIDALTEIKNSTFVRAVKSVFGFRHRAPIFISDCMFDSNYDNTKGAVVFLDLSSSRVTIINSNISNNYVISETGQGGALFGVHFNITNSIFYNNSAGYGAAVHTSTYSITNSQFISNVAEFDGGAIYSSTSGSSDITVSTFIDNKAGNSGGAIYSTGNRATITINRSHFYNNTALRGFGGVIMNEGRMRNISVTGSTFFLNSACWCGVLDFTHENISFFENVFSNNLALNDGGVACIRNASFLMISNLFELNSAGQHGGVFSINESIVSMERSMFVNNSASENGGAVYSYDILLPTTYTIICSLFSHNSAGSDGGAISVQRNNDYITISHSEFSFNNANMRGGAIAIIGTTLHISQTNVSNNNAQFGGVISSCSSVTTVSNELTSTTDPNFDVCQLYDGYMSFYPNITCPESVLMETSDLDSSNAETKVVSIVLPSNPCLLNPFLIPPCITLDQFAANPSVTTNTTLDMESGTHPLTISINVFSGNNFTIMGTDTIINCSSRSIEINIQQFSHTHIAGVRFTNCGGRRLGRDGRTLVLNKVSFVNSSGRYIYGSESIHISNVYIENAGSFHAGFYARPQRLVVEDSVFVNAGELIIWNTDYSRIERCSFTHSRIYLSIDSIDALTEIKNSTFVRAVKSVFGFRHRAPIFISDCLFDSNYDNTKGAVVFLDLSSSHVTIINSNISNNYVISETGQGGALFGVYFNITNSIFYNNSAGYGAAVHTSTYSITNSQFISNVAEFDGGAIYSSTSGSSDITDTVFTSNKAGNSGGVIYSTGNRAVITVTRSYFHNNTAASGYGGAIFSDGYTRNISVTESNFVLNSACWCGVLDFLHENVSFVSSNFTDNVATYAGGVACVRNASLSVFSNIFNSNSAGQHGGVFSINESIVTIEGSLFTNNNALEDGGALYSYDILLQTTYTIICSLFSNNSAGDEGGAISVQRNNDHINITHSNFSFNSADVRGGAIAIVGTTLFLNKTRVSDNTAQFGGVISSCNSEATVPDELTVTTDPIFDVCQLYDGHIWIYPNCSEFSLIPDIDVESREQSTTSTIILTTHSTTSIHNLTATTGVEQESMSPGTTTPPDTDYSSDIENRKPTTKFLNDMFQDTAGTTSVSLSTRTTDFDISSELVTGISAGGAGIAIAGFVLIIVIVIMIHRCAKYSKSKHILEKRTDLLPLNERKSSDSMNGRNIESQLTLSVQTPYNIELPPHLLLPSSMIELEDCIGQGEFGIVYRGQIVSLRQDTISKKLVAIKTLKGFYDHNMVREMLKECCKMCSFDHPNVLTLIGVCLDGGPVPYIIMPFMANGSLLTYIRKNRKTLVFPKNNCEEEASDALRYLMDMCIQVAKGMEYLARKGIIHRDLAARNCMIDVNFVIKVADFGLSENIGKKEYFRQDKDDMIKLPFKWSAPESIDDYVFSEKSDVWAYGVTCWELFSGGKVPYSTVNVKDLSILLNDGYRLEEPENAACCREMYAIMVSCWELDPVDRPSFSDLVKSISLYLADTSGYMSSDNKEVLNLEKDEVIVNQHADTT